MGCNIMNFSTTSSSSSLKGLCSPIPNNNNHNQKNKLQKALSSSSSSSSSFSLRSSSSNVFSLRSSSSRPFSHSSMIVKAVAKTVEEPLHVMISGAPASGKGTQCHLITNKYGLVHVAAGDLLRAEIETGSENGKRAKEYMEKGQLVPDEIVVMMVKDRLLKPDSVENGWLLDGYPRSLSQATALKELGFKPDIFILLEVSEDILVERVVGRRLDPVTGKIYHLKYSPPETKEIADRLTQRFDDTEEKVKLRLNTHHQNVEAVLSMYKDITIKINGNSSQKEVFAQIDGALTTLLEQRKASSESMVA
ncbi:putative adenylate kinase [Medicago truncatula]|uniref:adenylate kinase n=1 Tax=Medicago truncatula TaxID=3880 RepID=G7JRB1_MEDTR|nr:adenylate kinase, chloroplastic [Medicago truncatula]AES87830.1 adenylate kinase [Medicago truncatula]AFK34743.1 unknown [Medicago truncatula]RHN59752.1 putative adenylate kinase [Medicago truncatula]